MGSYGAVLFQNFYWHCLRPYRRILLPGPSYPLWLPLPWEVHSGVYCSGCNLCACLLVGAQQRSMNNHPDRVTSDCIESALHHKVEREGAPKASVLQLVLRCGWWSKNEPLRPPISLFPREVAFPLSFLPSSQALACLAPYFDFGPPQSWLGH